MQPGTQPHLVSTQFSPQAEAYLRSPVHAQGEDLATLATLIGGRPNARALDLGCGGGHVSFVLAPRVAQVVAYDLSEAMVATTVDEARRRGHLNVEGRVGVAERLPYTDASFDIVVSRYSAHHWSDVSAGVREVHRILKPGGIAVFMDVVTPGLPLLDTWLQSLELLRDPSHVRNYCLAQWHSMTAAAGFKPVSCACYRVRLEFQSWTQRMATPEPVVAAIRGLQSRAPAEVRSRFDLQADGSFTVDSMLMCLGP